MLALRAPAKINWFLRLKGRRPDGYHEISSLLQCVALFDTLTLEEAPAISVITEAPIAGGENLVTRAALALKEASKTAKGARISLVKNIPIAAGLGGGSSDAAATLRGLNSLWEAGLSNRELHDAALGLGSDVPFFLQGPAALVGGRGEEISPVGMGGSFSLVLLNPGVRVSAGWAYAEARRFSGEEPDYEGKLLRALNAGDFDTLRAAAVNDLEEPVARKHPEVAGLKKRLYEEGALFAAMSGSGPTVFGAFESRAGAEEARRAIRAAWSAVADTLTAAAE
jgi:4-diphosphocytidyl-2-C-methyl-D-erythritol kinase